jgi:hypothetical protein
MKSLLKKFSNSSSSSSSQVLPSPVVSSTPAISLSPLSGCDKSTETVNFTRSVSAETENFTRTVATETDLPEIPYHSLPNCKETSTDVVDLFDPLFWFHEISSDRLVLFNSFMAKLCADMEDKELKLVQAENALLKAENHILRGHKKSFTDSTFADLEISSSSHYKENIVTKPASCEPSFYVVLGEKVPVLANTDPDAPVIGFLKKGDFVKSMPLTASHFPTMIPLFPRGFVYTDKLKKVVNNR